MKKTRKRRPQARAEETKEKLMAEAIRQFSERGFDAVTVREIEVNADVQRNLLKYHFGSKENLWKEAVTTVFDELQEYRDARVDLVKDLSPHERIAYVVRAFVRFNAAMPEFNRFMLQEGKHDSWRMRWLVDKHLAPAMERLRDLLKDDLELSEGEFLHWYYMFVGAASLMFSMEHEVAQLFAVDVHEEDVLDRHAKMMVEFLLSREKKS